MSESCVERVAHKVADSVSIVTRNNEKARCFSVHSADRSVMAFANTMFDNTNKALLTLSVTMFVGSHVCDFPGT